MNTLTIISLVIEIEHSLYATYNDPLVCNQYAWWIIERITHKDKSMLLAQETIFLTDEQKDTLTMWLEKLNKENMPIAYLFGNVPFNDVDILVEPPTLIPRPETEEWCVALINRLEPFKNNQLTLLDLCCGSGCIAIALAKALPHATVYAVDKAPTALELTKKNSLHNKVTNVIPLSSDLFNDLDPDIRFDIIVSNPPYIPSQEWHSLDTTVTAWEDRDALIADDNGLAIIKKIIKDAPRFIKNNNDLEKRAVAQIIIEIDHTQGHLVQQLMQAAHYNNSSVHKDLEGKDRTVSARVDHVATSNHSS